MKKIILGLTALSVFNCFANVHTPDFTCTVDDSGYSYKYYSTWSELHQFNADGSDDDHRDGLEMTSVESESGSTLQYSVRYHTEQQSFLDVNFAENEDVGSGTIFGESVSCTR